MSEPQVNFRHEYISGAMVSPVLGRIFAHIMNRGSTDEFARVQVYDDDRFVVQSNEAGPSSVGDLVRPDQLWKWYYGHNELGIYWLRILTTSLNLVPSVQFEKIEETDVLRRSTYAYQAPGDLAEFGLPFRFPRVGPNADPVEIRSP